MTVHRQPAATHAATRWAHARKSESIGRRARRAHARREGRGTRTAAAPPGEAACRNRVSSMLHVHVLRLFERYKDRDLHRIRQIFHPLLHACLPAIRRPATPYTYIIYRGGMAGVTEKTQRVGGYTYIIYIERRQDKCAEAAALRPPRAPRGAQDARACRPMPGTLPGRPAPSTPAMPLPAAGRQGPCHAGATPPCPRTLPPPMKQEKLIQHSVETNPWISFHGFMRPSEEPYKRQETHPPPTF